MNKFGNLTKNLIPGHDDMETERKAVQKVLFLAPEWGTITKVGGLADVVTSLSQALIDKGMEVRTVLLGYRHINLMLRNKYFNPRLPFFLLEECAHPDYPKHIFYLIKHPALGTIHEPYTPSYSANDSSLDLLQAILLALAPFAIAENPSILWKPDLVHCHDWLCGLYPYFNHHLPALLHNFASRKIPSVFTIHNAEYMGTFDEIIANNFYSLLRQWGIAISHNFKIDAWKYEGQVNLLATGLKYAERINTVSPTHARELLTQGAKISPVLQQRSNDFCGILNGVDNTSWNPSRDPYLKEYTYKAKKREVRKAKIYWRKYLQQRIQFALNPKLPLIISICRIVKQKGLDQLFGLYHDETDNKVHGSGPMLEALSLSRCQLIILGEGEQQLEMQLQMFAWQYPQSFVFLNYFHEEMAHILTAAADFFIMPSQYEPCGLNQIYSLRYGTTPIVRRTGGLADTIQHRKNGLLFDHATPVELGEVLKEAFYLWHRKPRQLWAMKQCGMEQDFSWQSNLSEYIRLYNSSVNDSNRTQPTQNLVATGHEPF